MSASQLTSTVHQWLLLLDISVEKKYINKRLSSHPEFPSALCITSLLDELGIDNSVAQVDETELSRIKTPFLAFIDNEKFSIVTQVAQMGSLILNHRWNGIVVLAEKPEHIIESSELKKIKASVKDARLKSIAAISTLVVLTSVTCLGLTLTNFILLLSGLAGLLLSGSIVLQETGIDNVLSKHLCDADENTGCNAVLNSKASSLPFGIKISDIGLSFFAGITLLLLINSFSSAHFRRASDTFIQVAYLASVPLTLVSIYYQWRVIKQWCTFCMLVIAILWLSTLVEVWNGISISISVLPVSTAVSVFGFFALPGIAWILVRQLLDEKKELKNSNILLQRIYRSPELLEAHLLRQPKIDVSPWPYDFQIGDANASCQMIVVSSHFCGPCAETHELLHTLVKRHKNNLGITIRNLVNKNEGRDSKEQVQRHMLQYALSKKGFLNQPEKVDQMLGNWYESKDIERFKESYPVTETIEVEEILRTQNEWFKTSDIRYTPTIIINGYKLENPYSPTDLMELSSSLIEIFADSDLVEESY